jgi:hypothetical protein
VGGSRFQVSHFRFQIFLKPDLILQGGTSELPYAAQEVSFMRAVLFAIVVALGAAVAAPAPAAALDVSSTTEAAAASGAVMTADLQPAELKLDINVNRGGGSRWYANPVWMAIGGLAVLVLLVLVVMAMRGGGTTIVKN